MSVAVERVGSPWVERDIVGRVMMDLSLLALFGLGIAAFLLLTLIVLTFRGRSGTSEKQTTPREL